jgi:hypothetical protein
VREDIREEKVHAAIVAEVREDIREEKVHEAIGALHTQRRALGYQEYSSALVKKFIQQDIINDGYYYYYYYYYYYFHYYSYWGHPVA